MTFSGSWLSLIINSRRWRVVHSESLAISSKFGKNDEHRFTTMASSRRDLAPQEALAARLEDEDDRSASSDSGACHQMKHLPGEGAGLRFKKIADPQSCSTAAVNITPVYQPSRGG
ncbi:hypothetical protein KOW79_011117 [Hemibagrus wyckioides]|uniref:Uncharacterized protein n=1 Tax=Hemibagrus wyckioides TaxID=337641 RepID=A0A9D3SHQ0_9TELE|nr:hypothetical protein KOW79_011117 [Hemibagrus wyckioides]